jgi:hypothetical protein
VQVKETVFEDPVSPMMRLELGPPTMRVELGPLMMRVELGPPMMWVELGPPMMQLQPLGRRPGYFSQYSLFLAAQALPQRMQVELFHQTCRQS